MAAPMEKTRHPGIYKRGSRYVVVYKGDGRTAKEVGTTIDAARRLKAARTADRDRGEFAEQSRVSFRVYAEEWVDRYQGNGRRGFTETTRELDYRRELERYAYPFFDARLAARWPGSRRVTSPSGSAGYATANAGSASSADRTVRRIVAPVRSCLSRARSARE